MKPIKIEIINEQIFDHNGGFICSGKNGLQVVFDAIANHYLLLGEKKGQALKRIPSSSKFESRFW